MSKHGLLIPVKSFFLTPYDFSTIRPSPQWKDRLGESKPLPPVTALEYSQSDAVNGNGQEKKTAFK